MKLFLYLLILCFSLESISCLSRFSLDSMQESFRVTMETMIGSKYSELVRKKERGFIGKRKTTEIRPLDNGNYLYIYGDYWVQYNLPKRTPCTVIFEVNQETDIVVNVFSEGEGCIESP